MRTQQQAFRAYYASMTDADLLAVAKNRNSFIPVAQTQLDEELRKRRLAASAAPPETPEPPRPADSETAAPANSAKEHRPRVMAASIGATEDQVSMVGTIPERVNKHGAKIEDIAGTGQHDSLGG